MKIDFEDQEMQNRNMADVESQYHFENTCPVSLGVERRTRAVTEFSKGSAVTAPRSELHPGSAH